MCELGWYVGLLPIPLVLNQVNVTSVPYFPFV